MENRPAYAEPRTAREADSAARQKRAGAAGSSRTRGAAASPARDNAAPHRTGTAYGLRRGGSFIVSTISTLSTIRRISSAADVSGCQSASVFACVPYRTLKTPVKYQVRKAKRPSARRSVSATAATVRHRTRRTHIRGRHVVQAGWQGGSAK